MDDFDEIDWEAKDDYKDFFFTYENEFFNSYQGTNPHEDIAESFSFFVMLNSEEIERNDDVKYQKLDFFYDYNELIDLRAAILENIYLLSRSEEHTSELQSRGHLVCRLLLEK